MDLPPVPKPRTGIPGKESGATAIQPPVPLPRTKVPANSTDNKVSVFNSIKNDVSKAISKGTLEKTLTKSRAVRDTITKSVIEEATKATMRLRRPKKVDPSEVNEAQRCVSLPAADITLFNNLQFHSPMLEQKSHKNTYSEEGSSKFLPLNLNNDNLDDISLFSSNSDSNTDYASSFGHDTDCNQSTSSFGDFMYDTPMVSRTNSIVSTISLPVVPQLHEKKEQPMELMRQNTLYENWTLPMNSSPKNKLPQKEPDPSLLISRPSFSTIYEFDPLALTASSTPRYEGMSNELLLLESFLTADTYGTIVATDHHIDNFEDYGETDYYNPPTPPERFDSLTGEGKSEGGAPEVEVRESCSNWYVGAESEKNNNIEEDTKQNSMMTRFSRRLRLDSMLNKPVKPVVKLEVNVVARPPINTFPVAYYSGTLYKSTGMADDLFRNTQSRYCVLSDRKIICYSDPTNGVLKEAYHLDAFYALQIVLPLSSR